MWGRWDHRPEGKSDTDGSSGNGEGDSGNGNYNGGSRSRDDNHESWATHEEQGDVRCLETIAEESIKSARSSSGGAAMPEHPFKAMAPLNEVHPALRPSYASVSPSTVPRPPLPLIRIDAMKGGTSKEDPSAETARMRDVSPVSSRGSSINLGASDTSLVSPVESSISLPLHTAKYPLQAAAQQYISEDEQQQQQQPGSLIPRNIADPSLAVREKKQNTKWNRYTGEETSHASGLPSQAPKPGSQQPLELQYPQLKDRTRQILAGLREREAARKAALSHQPPSAAADPLDEPPQRVPWRGASGRTALVDPVQNTPAARKGPLQHARGPGSREGVTRPATDAAPIRSPSPQTQQQCQPRQEDVQQQQEQQRQQQQPLAPFTELPSSRSSPEKPQPSLRSVVSEESIKPVAPLKPRVPSTASYLEGQSTNPHAQQAAVPQGDLGASDLQHPVKSKYSFEPDSPPETVAATITRKAINSIAPSTSGSQIQRERESRQSWATYTSTEANSSPTPMARSTLASPPVSPLRQPPSPLVIRKRMTASEEAPSPYSYASLNHSSASLVSRKPVMSQQHQSVSHTPDTSTKSLPPTPVELQAGDKISTLEARLEDLARRRRNNTKINRELTANLAKNAIIYDAKKRKEVEKLKADLRLELDEIRREEHDVALILHRARKKRDRDSCYENPTGLWVRRVTS